MAEEQVVSQALILPNEDEKILEKLRNLQINNLTAKQQDNIGNRKKIFYKCFIKLSYDFLGLSVDQLKDFDANELKVLCKFINRKAKTWAISQIIFNLCFPIFGWILLLTILSNDNDYNGMYNLSYFYQKRYLKKIYGEKFLSEILYEKLKQN